MQDDGSAAPKRFRRGRLTRPFRPGLLCTAMASIARVGTEIQKSEFAQTLRSNLRYVLRNDFFRRLERDALGAEGYRLFVREKYSAVGYFGAFLENAERRLRPISPELAEAVKCNRLDEAGYFAGEFRPAYRHETWRLRSLKRFGVTRAMLAGPRLEGSRCHETRMRSLAVSEDAFELAGALLFLELFVVYEMKALIAAFERDLPQEFPQRGYSYDRFPFNRHEYWYGHALHDTWHFRALEEPLISLLAGEGSGRRLAALCAGIDRATRAKADFYGTQLFDAMASADWNHFTAPREMCR